MDKTALNVMGTPLMPCSFDPLTGYYRDGCCNTDHHDQGSHVVCAKVTQAFLDYSLEQGNDLMTPRPEYRFKGLKAGDRWCLCALRWKQSLTACWCGQVWDGEKMSMPKLSTEHSKPIEDSKAQPVDGPEKPR